MYESYFGLSEKPFSLLPDPRFLYVSETHKLAFTMLRYGLTEQAGFVVLTGEVGTGKTTLVRRLVDEAGESSVVGLASHTHAVFGAPLKWVLRAFEIPSTATDPLDQHDALVDHLRGIAAAGKRAVLIVDEAQNLSEDALEQLRILSNVNSGADQLLQLILVGQPELRDVLEQPSLRQFVQRIWTDHHLDALSLEETRAMIRHRVDVAGGASDLFDEEAATAVHYFTGGLPRLVNALCEMALVHGYAEEQERVTFETVVGVVEERQRGRGRGLTSFTPIVLDAPKTVLRRRILEAENKEPDPSPVAGSQLLG